MCAHNVFCFLMAGADVSCAFRQSVYIYITGSSYYWVRPCSEVGAEKRRTKIIPISGKGKHAKKQVLCFLPLVLGTMKRFLRCESP